MESVGQTDWESMELLQTKVFCAKLYECVNIKKKIFHNLLFSPCMNIVECAKLLSF